MLRQAPDDKGCITVNWPSKNVPHGGVFHSQKINHSNEKAEFLKVLIEETKLSTELRHRTWRLREDSADRCPSEVRQGGGEWYRRRGPSPPRPHTSRRRSLSCIRQSGDLEVDTWRPTEHGEDRDSLKQRLQELMEYGNKIYKWQPSPVTVEPPKPPKIPTAKDMRQELLTQIRERAEWIQEMEELGHAAPHRELIRDQIAERMRALAALKLDTERSTEQARETVRDSVRGHSLQGSVRGRDSARSVRGSFVKGSARDSTQSARLRLPQIPTSTKSSARTAKSTGRAHSVSSAQRVRKRVEENVAGYSAASPLAHSPRRRS